MDGDRTRRGPAGEGTSEARWSGLVERVEKALEDDPSLSRLTDVRIERSGALLHEWSVDAGARRDLFSVTKTVLALLFGVARAEGLVDLDERPALAEDWTFHDLLSMRRACRTDPPFDLDTVAVTEHRWAAGFAAAPRLERDAGFSYDNGSYQIVADELHHRTGDLEQFAADRLFGPVGITSWSWRRDRAGVPCGAGHLELTARDLARLGGVLNGGDPAVVDGGWLARMWTPASTGGPPEGRPYGLGVWVESPHTFFGAGWAGQLLLWQPRTSTVVVALSEPEFSYGPPASDRMPDDWRALLEVLRPLPEG